MEADEQEIENRRISKPRVKYSPPPFAGSFSRSLFKKQPHHRRRTHSPLFIPKQQFTPAPESPIYSNENSFFGQEEHSFVCDYDSDNSEVDEISQVDLRKQLSQLRRQDFELPSYVDITFGNSEPKLSSLYDYDDICFDSSLDDQEEIKVLKTPVVGELINDAYPVRSTPHIESYQEPENDRRISRPKVQYSPPFIEPLPLEKEKARPKVHYSPPLVQSHPVEKERELPAFLYDTTQMESDQEPEHRRISRPRVQYSPPLIEAIPRIKERDLFKKQQQIKRRSNEQPVKVKQPLPAPEIQKQPSPSASTELPKSDDIPIPIVKRKRGRPKRIISETDASSATLAQETVNTNTDAVRQEATPKKVVKRKMGESPISAKKSIPLQNLIRKRQISQRKSIAPLKMQKTPLKRKSLVSSSKNSRNAKSSGIAEDNGIKSVSPTKTEKSSKAKSQKQLLRLEFIRRMTQLRHLNPLAIGLRKGLSPSEGDYFYREILSSPVEPPSTATDEDIEVDCVGVSAPSGFDELFITNPAENCSHSIHKILSKSGNLNPIDDDDGDVEVERSERFKSLSVGAQAYLQIFLKFINDQRLVDATSQGIAGGASIFHSLTMKNANCLRESLRIYSKTDQSLIVESHSWLLRNLTSSQLSSYLNLLRFLKTAGSNLSEYIVSSCEESPLSEANKCILGFLGQKIYEPPLCPTSKFIDAEPIKNVSLVLVYPQINLNTTTCKHIIRAHETLFRNLLPLAVCCVEKVELNLNVGYSTTVEECTWMCIRLIRQRVKEIAKRRPNDHIFLAGWGTTCWLNHKAVSKIGNVSGLLDFAFPTESPCGSRGSVDDQICLTYPSTLFVVGEDAHNVRMDALRQLRKNMIADTGLIVIFGANHNLFVSPTLLSIERISQFIVQSRVVECVMQFIKQVITDLGSPKECRPFLKPVKLPNIYEVDTGFFKAKPAAPSRLRPMEQKGNRAEGTIRKEQKPMEAIHKTALLRHPTQIAHNLPAQLRPVAPLMGSSYKPAASLHSAQKSFCTSLKSASELKLADSLKIPSPEALNRQVPPLLSAHLSPPSSSNALRETLQEEEEAVAALASLK